MLPGGFAHRLLFDRTCAGGFPLFARVRSQRCRRLFDPGGRFVRAVLILVLAITIFAPPAVAQNLPPASFEQRQAQQFARSLFADQRYAEAVSFLLRELETLPPGAPRLKLVLLLADAQLAIGNLDGAATALAEAESLALESSAVMAVARRMSRLSELRELFPPLSPSGDTLNFPESPFDEALPGGQAEPLISNSFFETDLRQVLTDLSMETGIPILWDNTVQGLVTFEAVNRRLEDVLRSILMPMGYIYSLQNGTYFIGSPKPEDPAFGLLSITEVVSLSNLDATEAIGLLSDYFEPYVKASKTANTVCISAPPNFVERIRSDLALIDKPPVQILIEVVVSEISTDALRKIGLDWSAIGSGGDESWRIKTDHTDVDGAAIIGDIAKLGMNLGEYSVDLAASLEALVESGQARIRANPRIATLNGRTAEIGLTKDQYFIIATTTTQYSQYNTLQAVSSGIRLQITPYASPSGEITVHVKPEVGDVVGEGANNLPEISKRTASTSVRVKNGETFTIGGLNFQQEKKIHRKVPLLGDIPILGMLFRYDQKEMRDTQIVIFITPHILKG